MKSRSGRYTISSALRVVIAYKLHQKLDPGEAVVTTAIAMSRLSPKKRREAKGLTRAILERPKEYAVLD